LAADSLNVGGAVIKLVPPQGCVRVDGVDPVYDNYKQSAAASNLTRLAEFWKRGEAPALKNGTRFSKTVWYTISVSNVLKAEAITQEDMKQLITAIRKGLPENAGLTAANKRLLEERVKAASHKYLGVSEPVRLESSQQLLGILDEDSSSITLGSYASVAAGDTAQDAITLNMVSVHKYARVGPRFLCINGYSKNTTAQEVLALKSVIKAWHTQLAKLNPK